jgi:hypothetical protein
LLPTEHVTNARRYGASLGNSMLGRDQARREVIVSHAARLLITMIVFCEASPRGVGGHNGSRIIENDDMSG